jgi:hypothetical protein
VHEKTPPDGKGNIGQNPFFLTSKTLALQWTQAFWRKIFAAAKIMNHEIEAYINGELPDGDRRTFESRLLLDPALREEVEQQKLLMESLEYLKIKRQAQTAIHETHRLIWKRKLATVILLISIAGALFYFARKVVQVGSPQVPLNEPQSPTEKFRPPTQSQPADTLLPAGKVENREPSTPAKMNAPIAGQPEPADDRYRGDAAEAIDSTFLTPFDHAFLKFPAALPAGGSFDLATRAIRQGNYAEGLNLLKKREAKEASNDTLQYLLAIVQLQQHRPSAAAGRLYALNRPGNAFRPEAQWLSGLGLLLQGKEELARQAFQLIAKDKTHPRRAAAAEMLERLE